MENTRIILLRCMGNACKLVHRNLITDVPDINYQLIISINKKSPGKGDKKGGAGGFCENHRRL